MLKKVKNYLNDSKKSPDVPKERERKQTYLSVLESLENEELENSNRLFHTSMSLSKSYISLL